MPIIFEFLFDASGPFPLNFPNCWRYCLRCVPGQKNTIEKPKNMKCASQNNNVALWLRTLQPEIVTHLTSSSLFTMPKRSVIQIFQSQ